VFQFRWVEPQVPLDHTASVTIVRLSILLPIRLSTGALR
jgi:hypothetical protein